MLEGTKTLVGDLETKIKEAHQANDLTKAAILESRKSGVIDRIDKYMKKAVE
jgi:hypothetical protein